MANYPPRRLTLPPKCAGKAALTLTTLFNEATEAIPSWPALGSGVRGTLGWSANDARNQPAPMSDEAYQRSSLAHSVVARGAWQWEGKAPVVFFRGGRVFTPWGSGSWSLAGDAIGVSLGKCGSWRLLFSSSVRSFTASSGYGGDDAERSFGSLAPAHERDKNAAASDKAAEGWGEDSASEPIAKRLIGTGPWSWTGVAPISFLPHGKLFTPWGSGVWWPHPDDAERSVQANFVGQKHKVTFDECWSFTSVRESDGDKAVGFARIEPPATECPELSDSTAQR